MWGIAENGRLGSESYMQESNDKFDHSLLAQPGKQKVISKGPIEIPSPECGWTLLACGGQHTLARSGNG